jgi:hypothetical protein
MKLFSRLYVKYLIKTPLLFYLFFSIGAILFVYMTISVRIDVMKTYDASYKDGVITIAANENIITEKIFVYSNRNEKIYGVHIDKVVNEEDRMYIYVAQGDDAFEKLLDDIKVDMVIGKQSLLERIFVKAGKG